VYSMRILRVVAFGTACVAGTAAVRDHAAGETEALSSGKVGVINVRSAIASTAEARQALAELQIQFAPRYSELEAINKQIEKVRHRLEASQTLGEEEGLSRANRQGEHLTVQLDLKNKELNEDRRAAQAEVDDRIGRRVTDLLVRYSREKGYTAVLDTSAANGGCL
jgi:Skp family chaperone for outer membrane proteins